jgi:arsenite-transporting ATPase
LSGLQAQRKLYESSLAALADSGRTTLLLVSRPHLSALKEAERTRGELAALGVKNQRLVLNGIFQAPRPCGIGGVDAVAGALQEHTARALSQVPLPLRSLPTLEVPLLAHNLVGIAALRALYQPKPETVAEVIPMDVNGKLDGLLSLSALVSIFAEVIAGSELVTLPDGRGSVGGCCPRAEPRPSGSVLVPILSQRSIDDFSRGGRGVIMTMGKGGVGKTTVAAAIATELARRGFKVHLSTTDPAAHVAAVAGAETSGLRVSRIDPAIETRAYVEQVMASTGRNLDDPGRALLEEDLRSPCTEEVAVFRAFARIVSEGQDGFVVLDTAPTGHTLLLLDATEAYHREIARNASDMPEEVRNLLPRLRDPAFTRILLVTLPEPTPVHEAADLQSDLRRAGIEPWAWVINQSFAVTGTRDPILASRGQSELPLIQEVAASFSKRAALVPWFTEEPIGLANLRQFFL